MTKMFIYNEKKLENVFYESAEIIAKRIDDGYYDLNTENCGIKVGLNIPETITLDEIAFTGDVKNLKQSDTILIFDCGSSTQVIS